MKQLILFFFVAWSIISVMPALSQEDQSSRLLGRKIALRVERYDMERALRVLSDRYKIPIGIEQAFPSSQELDAVIVLNVSGMPLSDVLDALVNADPRYKWEIKRGVVNVVPKKPSNALGVKIPEFSVAKMGRESVSSYLVELPTLVAGLSNLGLVASNAVEYDGPLREDFEVTMRLQDATLESL